MATPGAAASSGAATSTQAAAAATASSSATFASNSSSTSIAGTNVFLTPALTSTFTPPPQCTQGHITMLERQQYFIWQNEPLPVPNSTFSECYPSEFITSYISSYSSITLPAFSPLVCPDNYLTVYSSEVPDRPLYVACCPSSYGLHPPDSSTPGRPAFGGTCFSNILSVSVTQYDNSSSSGVMLFSTSGQAYAHVIDGFAKDATTSSKSNSSASSASRSPASTTSPAITANYQTPILSGGAIAGIVIGAVAFLLILLSLITLCCVLHRRRLRNSNDGRGVRGVPLPTQPWQAHNERFGGPHNPSNGFHGGTTWINEKALPPHPPGSWKPHAELSPAWPRKPSEMSSTPRFAPYQELPDYNSQPASELDTSSTPRTEEPTPSLPGSAWVRQPGRKESSSKSPLPKHYGGSVSRSQRSASSPGQAVSPISAVERSQRFGSETVSEL